MGLPVTVQMDVMSWWRQYYVPTLLLLIEQELAQSTDRQTCVLSLTVHSGSPFGVGKLVRLS